MEVKKGYKQTDIGVIPEDWGVKKLGEIGFFKKGKGINKDSVLQEGLPCIRYGEIYTHYNNYIKKFNSFIDIETANKSQRIKFGDLLFTGSGETADEIGKCVAYLGKNEAYAGGDIIILSPSNGDSKYLCFLLNDNIAIKQKSQLGQGDAVVHIYSSNLSKIFIPFPPTLLEQTAIANTLSDIDSLITSLEKLIAKKRTIKQGAMQELLTGKKRLLGFNGEWEVRTIDEISEVKSGKRLPLGESLIDKETSHPYIRVLDMFIGGVDLANIKYVPDDIYPLIKNYRIFVDDIFISVAGTLGIVGKIPQKLNGANLTENADRITNITCNRDFLLYILMSFLFQNKIEAERTLGAQPKLALIRIRKFQISLPPTLTEQTAIAQVLSCMDSEIEALEKRIEKYKAIKQGMMQELLTGKIRLREVSK